MLQASLAFEAAVFKNLLLGGHPLQCEAHLTGLTKTVGSVIVAQVEDGVAIDQA